MRKNNTLKKLVILAGPTGVGKTQLAITLAKQFKSSIISSDSRQLYKELNIGVACPSIDELKQVPHYFIKNISIKEDYSIGQYEQDGLKLLSNLFKQNEILFLCGGSGLYIDALCKGVNQFPIIPKKITTKIYNDLDTKGLEFLVEELKKNDVSTYNSIDIKNSRRIIRALEVFRTTKIPYSKYISQQLEPREFKTLYIALDKPRDTLYNAINRRVNKMMENGLLDEVKSLYKYRNHKALQTIGYQELFKYLDGEILLDNAIEEIKKNSRRYAKRQITWFNKSQYHHFNIDNQQGIVDIIKNYYK